jgi:hypothetical protein
MFSREKDSADVILRKKCEYTSGKKGKSKRKNGKLKGSVGDTDSVGLAGSEIICISGSVSGSVMIF